MANQPGIARDRTGASPSAKLPHIRSTQYSGYLPAGASQWESQALRAKVDGSSSASGDSDHDHPQDSSVFVSAGAGASAGSRARVVDNLRTGSTPHRGATILSDKQQQQLQSKFDQQLVAKEVDLTPSRIPRPRLNQDSQLASDSARDRDSSHE